jgi:hypothetical protein
VVEFKGKRKIYCFNYHCIELNKAIKEGLGSFLKCLLTAYNVMLSWNRRTYSAMNADAR